MLGQTSADSGIPSTDWSVLAHSVSGGGPDRARAIDNIARRYLRPLRAFLRRRWRLSDDKADEVLQSFFCAKVLEGDLLHRFAPERGRFRSLLVASLQRHAINLFHRDRHRDRVGADVEPAAASSEDPACAFEREWGHCTLDEAILRMRRQCEAEDRLDLWEVFDGRLLGPALDGTQPLAYEQLVRRFALASPLQAANLLVTAKRMFARVLRGVVRESIGSDDPEEVERELRNLIEVFARRA